MVYMVKGFETYTSIRCEAVKEWQKGLDTTDMAIQPTPPAVEAPRVGNHDQAYEDGEMPEEIVVPWYNQEQGQRNGTATFVDSLFVTVYEVLNSLEFAVGSVETFISTSEFISMW